MKIIGLTSSISDGVNKCNNAYVKAFTTEHTTPMTIPMFKGKSSEIFTSNDQAYLDVLAQNLVERLDGLVLTGGNDINPINNEDVFNGSAYTNYYRDLWELVLACKFIDAQKPCIGICRGMQLLGTMYGLKLNQELSMVDKQNEIHNGSSLELPNRDEPLHEVETCGDFKEWVGVDKMNFNSFHHQGFLMDENKNIDKLGLELLAKTPNVIEMFRVINAPVMGCQAHPEEIDNSIVMKYIMEKYLQ